MLIPILPCRPLCERRRAVVCIICRGTCRLGLLFRSPLSSCDDAEVCRPLYTYRRTLLLTTGHSLGRPPHSDRLFTLRHNDHWTRRKGEIVSELERTPPGSEVSICCPDTIRDGLRCPPRALYARCGRSCAGLDVCPVGMGSGILHGVMGMTQRGERGAPGSVGRDFVELLGDAGADLASEGRSADGRVCAW